MKFKTGIDIIEVQRVKENIETYGEKFLNKVFTQKEIEYCNSKKAHKFESYAGRFAGKEAVFKAISDILPNKFDIDWKDIEIINDKNGRPFTNIKITNYDINVDISISHVKDTAIASVIMWY